ncbi:MAG: CHAT domain-containing protein [Aureispira sp.]
MRILCSYFIYSSLLLFLLGLCSSFQRPDDSASIQLRWEWAQEHHAVDSLLFYHKRLQEAYKATGNTALATRYNRLFLAYVLKSKVINGEEKKQLLEQYTSTETWNYAYRVQWYSQYGQRDSAYFYQSLLEQLPEGKAALIYAYGQLAVNFGLEQQNYRAAYNYLRQAEKRTETASDSQWLYPIQMQVYAGLGQIEQATKAGIALVTQKRQEKKIDSIALATVVGQLGQLYQEQGRYQEATIYIGEAINYLADRKGHTTAIGALWYQLAAAYYQMENKPLETILYARNALAKWEESSTLVREKTAYIDVYQLLAKQFLKVEQLDSSQVYLDKIEDLQKNTTYQIAEREATQALLYQRLGQFTAEGSALRKALEANLQQEGKKGIKTATRWLALGVYYQEQKKWSAARQALKAAFWALSWKPESRALPPSNSLYSKRMALIIGNAQGKTLLALQEESKYAVSEEILQQQLEYNIALLKALQVQQPWNAALWRHAKQARQQLIEWQWRRFNQTGNTALLADAFAQAEANRQAVIGEQCQQHWEQNPVRSLVQLQEQLQQQQAQQRWFQEQIWEAYEQQDSSQLDWYRQQLAANNANWTLTHQAVKKQYKKYYEWYYQPRTIALDSLQRRLKTGDALLQYFEAKTIVYQFVLTKDTLVLRRVVWEEYQPTVLKYRKHFTNPKMRQYLSSGSFQDFCRTGHSLYYRLVHHDLFKKVQRLIIIPDGLLEQLPFETLLTEIPLDSVHKADFSKLDYLLKGKRIHYHYSSQLWWQSWQLKASVLNKELLAMGADYKAEEITGRSVVQQQLRVQLTAQNYMDYLLDSLSGNYAGDFYNNRYSGEYYYKDDAAKYGLLYLGFYGYNGLVNNGLPSLIMAEDGYKEEDNFLSFYEIQEQPIQADLVFLGNAYQATPQDLLMLGTSFLYAGSRGVILPLWQQDSTAAEVVQYYYEGLQQGLENDEALRQAKLRYLQTTNGSEGHPSHWAGYVLVGNQQTIKVAAPIIYIWWFLFPIAFISFLGWWSLRALRQRR